MVLRWHLVPATRHFSALHRGWAVLACFSSASASAAVLLSIGQNFTGATLGIDSTAVPPDANGAAGPGHYVELVNGRYSVYGKANGIRLQTMTDRSFWAQAGVTLTTGWDVTDPRIVFDTQAQRWFASQVDYDTNGIVNLNHFLLAVSATANPMGAWSGFSFSTNPGGDNFGDFPTLGVDAQGVYLAAELFDAANNLVGPSLWSIPKAGLLAATPSVADGTWFGILSGRGYFLQPGVCVDGSASGTVLATAGLGIDYSTGSPVTDTALVGSTIQNAGGPGVVALSAAATFTVPPYTAPPYPTQPDTTQNLNVGDSRFSATVYGAGGVLYAVHGTEAGAHSALRWYRLDATNFTVLESGTISDPNLDLFYPSIAASPNGTVVIACNGSSISNYVGSYALAGDTLKGVTSFGSLQLLMSGTASYQKIDPTGFSRWGDYSATCVDPADPTRFWTIQTLPTGSRTWSTQITQLQTSPLKVAFAATGANLQLSWPLQAANFSLQGTTNLATPSSWSQVNQRRTTNGNNIVVSVPATSARQFFRLSGGP